MRTLWNILNDLETSLENDGITPSTWKYITEARDTYIKDDLWEAEDTFPTIVLHSIVLLATFILGAWLF